MALDRGQFRGKGNIPQSFPMISEAFHTDSIYFVRFVYFAVPKQTIFRVAVATVFC